MQSTRPSGDENTIPGYLRQSRGDGPTQKVHGAALQDKKKALADVTNRKSGAQESRQGTKRSANDAELEHTSEVPAAKRTQTRLTDGGFVQPLADAEPKAKVNGPPAGVRDVDAEDKDIPHKVTEYVQDIHDMLREREKEYPVTNYLAERNDLNAQMREILIDWLVEVAEEYNLKSETLYLSVRLIDRFLMTTPVKRTKLQLVGVTAMLIASKYEEIYAPSIEEFVFITDSTYTRDEVLAMEGVILKKLEFKLGMPSIKNFLRRYVHISGGNAAEIMFTNYLSELTLTDDKSMRIAPSIVAAAAVATARASVGRTESWDKTLEYYSGIKVEDIKEFSEHLVTLARNAPFKTLTAIPDKYSRSKFNHASSMTVRRPFKEDH